MTNIKINSNDILVELQQAIAKYQVQLENIKNYKEQIEYYNSENKSHLQNLEDYQEAQVITKSIIDKVYEEKFQQLSNTFDYAFASVFKREFIKICFELTDAHGKSAYIKIQKEGGKADFRTGCEKGLTSFIDIVYTILNCSIQKCTHLFLDEKFQNLDDDNIIRAMKFCFDLAKEKGLKLILISHDHRIIQYCQQRENMEVIHL